MSEDLENLARPGPRRQRLSGLGLLVETINALPGLFVPILAGLYGTRNADIGAVPVIAGFLAFSLLLRALRWLRHYYILSGDDIRIEQGLFSHSVRSIPFERIVDVTIEQPALGRVLGLAIARFETGGGKGEEAVLRYVTMAEAERLRATVRHRKAETCQTAASAESLPDEAQVLFKMDVQRVLTLGFYSFSLVAFAVLLGLAAKFDFLLPDRDVLIGLAENRGAELSHLAPRQQLLGLIAAMAATAVLGFATGVVRIALRDWGFVLERTPKGLRRRRGLLTHTDMTLPLEKVQGVDIGSSAVRARHGWHALYLVSMADAGEEKYDQMVAPLARLDEIWPIVRTAGIQPPAPDLPFVRPGFAPRRDWAVLRSVLLLGTSAAAACWLSTWAWLALIPTGWLALRDWLNWRREGWAIDGSQLYCRAGWWHRVLAIFTQDKVHAVTITRGPLERRHGLASLHFGIANGGMVFRGLPLADAEAIRERVLRLIAPVDFSRLNARP